LRRRPQAGRRGPASSAPDLAFELPQPLERGAFPAPKEVEPHEQLGTPTQPITITCGNFSTSTTPAAVARTITSTIDTSRTT
jgi:hypothetical protein